MTALLRGLASMAALPVDAAVPVPVRTEVRAPAAIRRIAR
jgi:hypothetical protein